MGHNSYLVQSVEDVKSDFDRLGREGFIKIYSKYNTFLGDEMGIQLILDILNKGNKSDGK